MVKTTLQPLLILSIAESRLRDYAMNVPKRLKKKFESILPIAGISLGLLTILLALYGLFLSVTNEYPLEKAIKNWDKINEDQEFFRVKLIDEKTGVAFVNYGCESKRVLKGIKKCKGQYYIFLNRIDDVWVVNESSKRIIW